MSRAFLCYGSVGDPSLDNIVAWCAWITKHTAWALTLHWTNYASGSPDHDPVQLEICRLIEEHSHVILLGEVTPRLLIQRRHARVNDITVVDLTAFGSKPPSLDSIEHVQVLQAIHLNGPNEPGFVKCQSHQLI